MILITGASGNAGGAVLAEVHKSGVPFKAMYRSTADAGKAPMGIEAVIADFADKASLKQAFAGVESMYLVCSPIRELVQLESNAIDVAKEAGVKHIVLNSALGAEDYPRSFPAWHRTVEERLKASGMAYTILRPNSFMQNILAYLAPGIRAQSASYAAMGQARTSYIELGDIGAVAAKALLQPGGHHNQTYELNGPEAVTYTGLATRISRVAGREIKFVDIPENAQRQAMLDLGMPQWQVEALLDLQRYYTLGQGGEVTGLLSQLLGREPVRLNDFLAANKEEFRSETPAPEGGPGWTRRRRMRRPV